MPRESRGIRANGIVRVSPRAFLEFYRGARRPRSSLLYGAPRRLGNFGIYPRRDAPGRDSSIVPFVSYIPARVFHAQRARDARFNYATSLKRRRVQR